MNRAQHVAGAPLRAAAARAVHAVTAADHSLDRALAREHESIAEPRDRALLASLVYGTLRWYPRLQAVLSLLVTRPLPTRDRVLHDLMAVGLYQLEYSRVAAHAAVHTTVAAATLLGRGHGRGLVNAVLRRYQRERAQLLAAADADPAARYAHPSWLVQRLQRDYPAEAEALLAAGNAQPPMWLRVNRRHQSRDAYRRRLEVAGIAAREHPEAPDALALEAPLDVSELPGFDQGDVSVQDAAAQLAVEYLDLAAGQRLLDACAAPGGKTAHALEREPRLAEVVALDRSARRLEHLQRGLKRLGLSATSIAGDAEQPAHWWDKRPFDRILLDAPCSATGVIRRHPDIKLRRTPQAVATAARSQAAMLVALWPLLAPGGRLVYATCSLLAEENEEQIAAFLRRQPDARLLPPGDLQSPGRRILAGELDMDGFYYACLQRADRDGDPAC